MYSGQIKALSRYYNDNSIMSFQCESCGLVFFSKISHIVGKLDHRHVCHKDYGGQKVNNRGTSKRKGTHIDGDKLVKQLDEMLDEGAAYGTIRSKLRIDTHLIRYYDETFHKTKRQG